MPLRLLNRRFEVSEVLNVINIGHQYKTKTSYLANFNEDIALISLCRVDNLPFSPQIKPINGIFQCFLSHEIWNGLSP
jgi:hypothetical protein